MFKNAKWITGNSFYNSAPPDTRSGYTLPTDGSFYMRKEFSSDKKIINAKLICVALGYGVFTINGKMVTDDVLTTPFTKFDDRVIYSEYDVTDLISDGKNVIGAYIGNGWYNDVGDVWDYEKATWRDEKKLICKLILEYQGAEKAEIVSDTSWVSHFGPSIRNHIREGEIYDARLEIPGWDTPSFDASSWANCLITRHPGGILETTDMPPIRISRSITPVKIADGIYDFKEAVSGWAKIRVKGNPGDKITITYAEMLKGEDIDNANIIRFTNGPIKHQNIYTVRGEDWEEWHPSFVYHAFRYIKVEGAPEDFEITADVFHTDIEKRGSFKCSNELINKLHEASVRSTLYNFHSIPTDCPHREQNGWTGDALISAQQALMNFDMFACYKKWMNDFKDVQRKSGQLPGIIPTSKWGYNWGCGPAWDSALILIPGYVYDIDGSTALIEQMWDNMKLYMEYFDLMTEDYISDFGLGDWCPPLTSTNICPTAVTDTALYYVDLKAMAKYAGLLGVDGSEYEENAEKIKDAWRKKFMNQKRLMENQTFLACGIYQGLFNEDEIPQMAKKLSEVLRKNDYHIDCGILGAKYLFSALTDNGYGEDIYKMISNPTEPSYAFWINNGYTALGERWHIGGSLFHNMYSEIEYWFYRHIAGIRYDGGVLSIKPTFLDEVEWVKATHKDISVYYDRKVLKVTVPSDTDVIVNGKTTRVSKGEHTISL